jgi:hypothetical protein
MVKKPDKDEDVKTKAQALFLARESASHIENVLTNNKHLVDEAFKFAFVKSSSPVTKNPQDKIMNKR